MTPLHKWFDDAYRQHYDMLKRIAFHLTGDATLAEDVVQNVFMTFLTKYETLKDHPNLQGWLIQAVKYQVQSEMQKAYHSREVPFQPDMEFAAKDADTTDFLELLPRELSEQDRQLIYLHCEMGLPHEEIAAMLGCSPVACRMRFSRARNRCQKILLKEKNINSLLHSTLFDKYKE